MKEQRRREQMEQERQLQGPVGARRTVIYFFVFSLPRAEVEAAARRSVMVGVETRKVPESASYRSRDVPGRGSSPQANGDAAPSGKVPPTAPAGVSMHGRGVP